MKNHHSTIYCVVSVKGDAVTPVVAYQDSRTAENKARERNRARLSCEATYHVKTLTLIHTTTGEEEA